jgi:hypothetical protein
MEEEGILSEWSGHRIDYAKSFIPIDHRLLLLGVWKSDDYPVNGFRHKIFAKARITVVKVYFTVLIEIMFGRTPDVIASQKELTLIRRHFYRHITRNIYTTVT